MFRENICLSLDPFSNGKVKAVTNSSFTTIKNPYEITFDTSSDIRPAPDTNIGPLRFSFVKIADLVNKDNNALVGK